MASFEGNVPPFSMWKVFYDTMKLLELDHSESKIEHLANIINSEKLTSIFVYNPDGSIEYVQYNVMCQKYKAFTIWLLGKFFYLSTCSNLARIHKLVTDVQLRILNLISITQPHIHHELAREYSNILKLINQYKDGDKLELTIFKIHQFEDLQSVMALDSLNITVDSLEICNELKKTLLIFMHHIIIENLKSHYIDSMCIQNFDNIIHILKEDNLILKLDVLKIFEATIRCHVTFVPNTPSYLTDKFDLIIGLLEQLVYDMYNAKVRVDEDFTNKVETILILILNNKKYSCDNFKSRISKFILDKIYSAIKVDIKVSEELQIECFKISLKDEKYLNSKFNSCSIDEFFTGANSLLILKLISYITLQDLKESFSDSARPIYVVDTVSTIWHNVSIALKEKLCRINCGNTCTMKKTLLFLEEIINIISELKIQLKDTYNDTSNIEFFAETEFIILLFSYVNKHIENCKTGLEHEVFVKVIMKLPIFLSTSNIEILFLIIGYPFLTLFYKSNNELPVNLSGRCDRNEAKRIILQMYKHLAILQESKTTALKNICDFMCICESGLINKLSDISKHNLEASLLKIFTDVYTKGPNQLQAVLAGYIPVIISFFKNLNFVPRLFLHLTSAKDINKKLIEVLPASVCLLCSRYIKEIALQKGNGLCFKTTYHCIKCNDFDHLDEKSIRNSILKSNSLEGPVYFSKIMECRGNEINLHEVFKIIWKISQNAELLVLNKFMKLLLPLAKHMVDFHTEQIAKQWIVFAGHEDKSVRLGFSEVYCRVLKSSQENNILSKTTKESILKICLEELFKFTKKSLQYSDFDLQETLLETINEITELRAKPIPLETMKILLYFIMIPTSKFFGIAENYFLELARKHGITPLLLYRRYRRELSHCIVDLCAINQALVKYKMSKSLENISLVLGFLNARDFVCKESSYLMPYLVSLIVIMPNVLKLISEVADLTDTDQGELLASNYGSIFLYLFLNKSDTEFKNCMKYIETKTGMTSSVLRKRNFKIILNELLLNFHEKRDRVLIALKLLATEDTDGETMHIRKIPDYLQPRFLGVLQYFDTKLFAKKEVLLSLVEIFKFMGPKRIAPFRFKIIAMLRTALNLNHTTYPELNCNVWEAFVKNCDIESLGGQLAVIFVSLLPLSEIYPTKVNDIFSYLILLNENLLKDYIADLFFVLDYNVAPEIHNIIRKYMERIEGRSFADRLRHFMKYLTHETNEVKIHALKFLKEMIKQNRAELDQMILGYNGMDSSIVELLEILTVCSREKDKALKLACGNCIGELAAIEPSHLPRKYTEAQSFIFFMTEDTFIQNSLNELIRALQAEKNTTIMDRFALAIQETLKIYGISPDSNAAKHSIWKSFSQAHKELMTPFLTSRYTMGQTIEPVTVSPIYESVKGVSFQMWSRNWTYALISTMENDKQNLLEVCFPSMKQNHRTLMHFLPHILLHSLIEGPSSNLKTCYDEFIAVINSYHSKNLPGNSEAYSKSLRTHNFNINVDGGMSEDVKQPHCIKVIFILLDFLERWIREWQWQRGAAGREDENYKKLHSFVSKFCKLQLAQCSFKCSEYSRALMYLEDYIASNPEELDNHRFFFSKIYAQLDEPDAVAGVAALQNKDPTLEQRILELEVSGKLSDAVSCYERVPPPLKLRHLQGLIQCYLDLDNVNTALNFTEGAIDSQPIYENYLLEMQAEPLWRLGKYEELENLLQKHDMISNTTWGVKIGQALIQIKNEKREEFSNTLNSLYVQQIDALGATTLEEGVYQHEYESIVKLHQLNELEQVQRVIHELLITPNDHTAAELTIKNLAVEWELRFKVVQESIKIIEPILCLRRVALDQAKRIVQERVPSAVPFIDSLLGECWLLSAKIARRAGFHQQAYTYTLKAEEYSPPTLFLERAKLHWLREEHDQALTVLTRGVEKLLPELTRNVVSVKRNLCAKAKLLIAMYNDKISNVDTETKKTHYKEAVEMNKEWEKSYVSLAQYYDRLFQTYVDDDRDAKASDIQIHMINYFGKSMLYGTNYVYQSMPRMLSIWFDYGTRLLEVTSSRVKDERKQNLLRMTKLIDTFLERLPSYIFLTAFSQIISRICHPQKEVYIELKAIIIKLLLQYPQQIMWMMISVIKSSYPVRSRRCAEILGDSRLRNPCMIKLITDFTKLAEKLIELCNKEIPDNIHVTNMNTLFRTLPRLLSKSDFSEIMIPTQKFRKLILPNPDFKSSQHNPFPNHYVYITGVEDEVAILQSLQRPRKITFRGSDGKGYIQMLKPKDDLRKDFRLMEFNDIVNQMLSRDPDSRQRRLNIRIYSVVPLNEECGLIEWIPKLVGLRPIVMALYKQKGQAMRPKELKESGCQLRDPLSKKRDIFNKILLPRHPPVLGEWFRKTFPDVQGWLTARTAYTRTTAVISMVGYILGLGDRHGENILLDSISGDTVHVDFNCLFNKGETFEWPERVPFRLTHNMVSAMGPLGVEGVFRKSSACTLKVLREHTDTLMSIVTPFVYDPLVSWPRNNPATSNAQNAERTNEQAVEHVRDIKLRLQGMVRTQERSYSIALSVEGQINNITEEAMHVDNLCQMYIGWGSYL